MDDDTQTNGLPTTDYSQPFDSTQGKQSEVIVEGEVVQNDSSGAGTVGTAPTVGADDLITLTNLINGYLVQIDREGKELTKHREMLEDSFNNDPTYRDQNDKVKDASKIRNATKAQIMKQPSVMELAGKVKEMAQGLKEAKEALSGYLQEYAKMTGEQSFEGPDGEVQQIVYTARLVKVGK